MSPLSLLMTSLFVEVNLCESWMAESREAPKGMFLAVMVDHSKFFIYKLWQMSQAYISLLE